MITHLHTNINRYRPCVDYPDQTQHIPDQIVLYNSFSVKVGFNLSTNKTLNPMELVRSYNCCKRTNPVLVLVILKFYQTDCSSAITSII